MDVETWGVVVAALSLPASAATLVVVVREAIRNRRRWPMVMWDLSHFGTLQRENGTQHLAAELVQFGGTPTRISWYYPVGFRVVPEVEARLRAYVRGEDRQPLFLDCWDRDNAWMLIGHTPRDSSRWMYVEWVSLDPPSKSMCDVVDERTRTWKKERRRLKTRLVLLWRRLPRTSYVEPVGPSGIVRARIRVDVSEDKFARNLEEVVSLAAAADPTNGLMRPH